MKHTAARTPCITWEGNPKRYQDAAARSISLSIGIDPTPYSWITPKCGAPFCVEPDHLSVQAPVHLAYPRGVCIYCGRHGWTKDHLFPRNWTGNIRRNFTALVPSCATCNSLISDALTWSITERRALCHERLRRKYAKVLRYIIYSDDQLDEFDPPLRQYVVDGMEKRAEVERMLSWPEDPTFDERALERSGIEDPYILGLILSPDVAHPTQAEEAS